MTCNRPLPTQSSLKDPKCKFWMWEKKYEMFVADSKIVSIQNNETRALKKEIEELKKEKRELKQEVRELKNEIGEMKRDTGEMKKEIEEMKKGKTQLIATLEMLKFLIEIVFVLTACLIVIMA